MPRPGYSDCERVPSRLGGGHGASSLDQKPRDARVNVWGLRMGNNSRKTVRSCTQENQENPRNGTTQRGGFTRQKNGKARGRTLGRKIDARSQQRKAGKHPQGITPKGYPEKKSKETWSVNIRRKREANARRGNRRGGGSRASGGSRRDRVGRSYQKDVAMRRNCWGQKTGGSGKGKRSSEETVKRGNSVKRRGKRQRCGISDYDKPTSGGIPGVKRIEMGTSNVYAEKPRAKLLEGDGTNVKPPANSEGVDRGNHDGRAPAGAKWASSDYKKGEKNREEVRAASRESAS